MVEPFGEWLFRMHGTVSSCRHTVEAEALAEEVAPLIARWLAEAKAEGAAEVRSRVEAVVTSLPAITEGPARVGTASWDRRDRDTYSLAIEEAQAAIRSALTEEPTA